MVLPQSIRELHSACTADTIDVRLGLMVRDGQGASTMPISSMAPRGTSRSKTSSPLLLVLAGTLAAVELLAGAAITQAQSPPPPPTPDPSGILCDVVTLPAGWNLIAGVWANDLAAKQIGPLYTYNAEDAAYRIMALPYGLWDISDDEAGYWVDLQAATQVPGACHIPPFFPQPRAGPQPITLSVAAGLTMISAPFNGFVIDHTIQGADFAFTFDAATEQYQQTDLLKAGEGAWVYLSASGEITLTPLTP